MSGISRAGRLATASAAGVLAVSGLSACGGGPHALDIAALDVMPSQLETVTFTANGQSATLRFLDGVWTPSTGATVQAATMLSTNAERMFPLNYYRAIPGLNQADPTYGLAAPNSSIPECGAFCAIKVVTTKGVTLNLTVGRPTFSKAGFYAKVDGDRRTFLITQQAVSDIISEATGRDFAFPESEKYQKIDKALNGINEEAKNNTADFDPYLQQVLAAEAADASQKTGKGRGTFVLNAASSTKGLPGAKDQRAVSNTGAANQQVGTGR